MEHITDNTIQEYIDKRLSPQELRLVSAHFTACPTCSDRMKSFAVLDRTIKRVPLETVSTDFTLQLMKRLNIKETPSFVWNIMTNIAPLLLVTIVLVILVGALQVSGAINTSEVSQSVQLTQRAYSAVSETMVSGSKIMNSWFNTLFPFKFTTEGFMFTLFLICLLSAIAIVDKFIVIKLLRKKS